MEICLHFAWLDLFGLLRRHLLGKWKGGSGDKLETNLWVTLYESVIALFSFFGCFFCNFLWWDFLIFNIHMLIRCIFYCLCRLIFSYPFPLFVLCVSFGSFRLRPSIVLCHLNTSCTVSMSSIINYSRPDILYWRHAVRKISLISMPYIESHSIYLLWSFL